MVTVCSRVLLLIKPILHTTPVLLIRIAGTLMIALRTCRFCGLHRPKLFVVQSRVPEANRLDVVRGQVLGTDCVVMRANVGMATFDRLADTGMTQEAILLT